MIKIFFHLVFIVIVVESVSFPQFQNVRISNLYRPNETSIMINPKNTNIIVAGANNNRFIPDSSFSGFYYSTNGGLNWSEGPIRSTLAGPSGDPCIVVDTNGYFYYTQNVFVGITPPLNVVLAVKSTNGGANWPIGAVLGQNGTKQQDKPWACVDLSHGPFGNYIYVTWTEFDFYGSFFRQDSSRIMFSRSTDGGLTFSTSKRISRYGGNAKDDSGTVEGAVPCVGPNGEIYVSWAGPRGICFNKSTDAGITWLAAETTVVPPYPLGWNYSIPGIYRCNGFPVTCCDVSNGPYNGTIYINWSDQRNGTTDTDIWLIKSSNGGLNWSSIKRVNDDPPGRHQFLTWMAIDQVTGYIYFVFYDRRNYYNNNTDVYLVRSTDGGETFANFKINETTLTLTGNVFIGDYNCISVHNNKVRPIWTNSTGGMSIWTAIVDSIPIGIKSISSTVPNSFMLYQNYPNPFNPVTKIKFDIPSSPLSSIGEGPGVRLVIYDILGREIAVLVNEKLVPGTYETEWDAINYPSGVYFYKLITKDFTGTKKMVLLK